MKNLHKIGKELFITNDEEIKEGDWVINNALQEQQQDKKLYSEEEVYDLFSEWFLYKSGAILVDEDEIPNGVLSFNQWFEQIKKK